MTNWCKNFLTVKGPPDEVERFKQKAVGFYPWCRKYPGDQPYPLNFHNLVPVPKCIWKKSFGDGRQKWQQEHWGCRGGTKECWLSDEKPGYLLYLFSTAWSPPVTLLKKICLDWPLLNLRLDFDEYMVGFSGHAKRHKRKFIQVVSTCLYDCDREIS